MPSNEELCSRSLSDLRQSYSNRICDDLSEVILQFLPFEDKLKFECVSKQFQRTVYTKQTVLLFDYIMDKNIEMKSFDTLLKKLPNIERLIVFFGSVENNDNNNEAFELIVKNCKHLTHLFIYSSLEFLRQNTRDLFLQKFGPQLVYIEMDENIKNFSLKTMVNIEVLVSEFFPQELPQIKCKRLKSLKICEVRDEDMDQLMAFLEINANSIRHLELKTDFMAKEVRPLKAILEIITKMDQLVHLGIDSYIGINDKRMATLWTGISRKCLHLKRLDISFDLDSENLEQMNEMLSPLKQFKELKRLQIFFQLFDEIDDENIFSFEEFKGFENLTHLTIISNSEWHYFFFTNIDINLPNLQSLVIRDEIEVNEESVGYLSRLLRLETIKLNITDDEFVSHLKTELQNRRKGIKTIDISVL